MFCSASGRVPLTSKNDPIRLLTRFPRADFAWIIWCHIIEGSTVPHGSLPSTTFPRRAISETQPEILNRQKQRDWKSPQNRWVGVNQSVAKSLTAALTPAFNQHEDSRVQIYS